MGIHEKLEEAMAENEKLRKEYQMKAESMENLRRAYEEQVIKAQDRSSKVENLTLELSLKEDELSAAKQIYEELKSNLKQKESAIKRLSSANNTLRANSDEERAKACRELRQRDEVLFKLEEQNRKLEDELKWKKEQFCHLVEAHEKLQNQFRERAKEWEKETETLFDQISTLQSTLDSQTRISEDLRTRLQMCNQALAHEETRRKFLEIQLSESKSCFHNVSAEYEEAKSRIDGLCDQRDKEIANLRDAFGSRETIYKETEYRFRKLEQEKQELMASLKELQEAGIKASGNSSLSKLRNKLKSKEAQWASEIEALSGDLDSCKSELKNKDALITELQKDLKSCNSLMFELTLQNEETSVMLLVLKSHLSEVYQSLANAYAAVNQKDKEHDHNISELMKQLDQKNSIIVRAEKDLEEERENVAKLSERIESLNWIHEDQLPLQIEVEALKEMLKEASAYQEHLKEQVVKTENDLKEANEELAEILYEGNEAEFELQIWRTIAERLKSSLDENLQMRRKVEDSLFAQMDIEFDLRQEKDNLIHMLTEKETETSELKQKIVLLNEELEKLEESERNHEKEKENFHHRIEDLQQLVLALEQEFENTTSTFLSRLSNLTDREMLVDMLTGLSDRIRELSMEDKQLSKELGRIMQSFNSNGGLDIDMKRVKEFFDPVKENLNRCPSPTKNVEAAINGERSPFRALNN